MPLPLSSRHPLPSSEPERLSRAARRTTIVRAALAAGLLTLLVLAFVEARSVDPRRAPLVPAGTTGMLVLDLSASVYEDAFSQTIRKLARAGEETGLVAFSDAGYELLPPGSPARELLPLLRFFKPEAANISGALPVDPWQDFRAGTRISEGLLVAHAALQRERAERGSIVLVSDLEILPDEVVRLSEVAAELRLDGIRLRIVPLFPTPEKYARIRQIVGDSSFLRESDAASPVAAPEGRSLAHAVPWTFVLIGATLMLLLSANEGVLPRLELSSLERR
ncbi:MAG: VWA domain-containing protein [Actinobacteria bacterium]|nr:VWA domain-containing protein [Actinomycetota bacterium]